MDARYRRRHPTKERQIAKCCVSEEIYIPGFVEFGLGEKLPSTKCGAAISTLTIGVFALEVAGSERDMV